MLLGTTQPQSGSATPGSPAPGASGAGTNSPAEAALQEQDIRKGQEALQENEVLKQQLKMQKATQQDTSGAQSFLGTQLKTVTSSLPGLMKQIQELPMKLAVAGAPQPNQGMQFAGKPAEQKPAPAPVPAATTTAPAQAAPPPEPPKPKPPSGIEHDRQMAMWQHNVDRERDKPPTQVLAEWASPYVPDWFENLWDKRIPGTQTSPNNILHGAQQVLLNPEDTREDYSAPDNWMNRAADGVRTNWSEKYQPGTIGSLLAKPVDFATSGLSKVIRGLPHHYASVAGLPGSVFNVARDVTDMGRHIYNSDKPLLAMSPSELLPPQSRLIENLGKLSDRTLSTVSAFTGGIPGVVMGTALNSGFKGHAKDQEAAAASAPPPQEPAPEAPAEIPAQDPGVWEQMSAWLTQLGNHIGPYLQNTMQGQQPSEMTLPSVTSTGGHLVSNPSHYV